MNVLNINPSTRLGQHKHSAQFSIQFLNLNINEDPRRFAPYVNSNPIIVTSAATAEKK